MNLSHLRYFSKLAELGSYTEASKALYITQPALSAAMKSLEGELGFPLTTKKGRTIELTEAGRLFNERVQTVLEELDRGIAESRAKAQSSTEIVRIGVVSFEQSGLLARAAQDCRAQLLPGVEFEILKDTRENILTALKRGNIDLAFTIKNDDDTSLVFTRAIPYRMIICTQESSYLAKRKTVSATDLSAGNIITYRANSARGASICSWARTQDVHVIAEFDDEATLMSMVRTNPKTVALLLVPWNSFEAPEGLTMVPVIHEEDTFFLYAAHKVNLPESSYARLFLTFLEKEYAAH